MGLMNSSVTPAAWDAWIDAKHDYDKARTEQAASRANGASTTELTITDPGLCPAGLTSLVGEPPAFFVTALPHSYKIHFDDCDIAYRDNVKVRKKYAYSRFDQGVMSVGEPVKSIPREDLMSLLKAAGLQTTEAKVMDAISPLEGGFDSVNTYDTGYVSVGLLQFATLKDGKGSLGAVLLDMKTHNGAAFQDDFRKFGIDVTAEGVLSVIDVATGQEKQGVDANSQIIEDKRLVATFQRAGRRRAFRIAQLRVARDRYYPATDPIAIEIDGKKVVGKVNDVVKSEAGLATLMDRKVNTGNIAPLSEVLQSVAVMHKVTSFQELAKYEGEIIAQMKYRTDFTKDSTLTQPRSAP